MRECLKALGINPEAFNEIMAQKVKNFHDHPNHYHLMRYFKPLFRSHLLPETIYKKLFDRAKSFPNVFPTGFNSRR